MSENVQITNQILKTRPKLTDKDLVLVRLCRLNICLKILKYVQHSHQRARVCFIQILLIFTLAPKIFPTVLRNSALQDPLPPVQEDQERKREERLPAAGPFPPFRPHNPPPPPTSLSYLGRSRDQFRPNRPHWWEPPERDYSTTALRNISTAERSIGTAESFPPALSKRNARCCLEHWTRRLREIKREREREDSSTLAFLPPATRLSASPGAKSLLPPPPWPGSGGVRHEGPTSGRRGARRPASRRDTSILTGRQSVVTQASRCLCCIHVAANFTSSLAVPNEK